MRARRAKAGCQCCVSLKSQMQLPQGNTWKRVVITGTAVCLSSKPAFGILVVVASAFVARGATDRIAAGSNNHQP